MQPEFEAILASDLPQSEMLSRAYQYIMREQIAFSRREIELQKAIGDQQALVKEQIKMGVLEYAYEIFAFCYLRVTGKKMTDG
jgi:hypothetical protein